MQLVTNEYSIFFFCLNVLYKQHGTRLYSEIYYGGAIKRSCLVLLLDKVFFKKYRAKFGRPGTELLFVKSNSRKNTLEINVCV